MQKWEYTWVYLTLIDPHRKSSKEERDKWWKVIEKKGVEGWECFSVTGEIVGDAWSGSTKGHFLWFKRPIEEG